MRMLRVILLHIENIDLYPFFVCYLTVIKSDTPPGSITINIAMVSTSCHFYTLNTMSADILISFCPFVCPHVHKCVCPLAANIHLSPYEFRHCLPD